MKYSLLSALLLLIMSTAASHTKPNPEDTEVWEPEPEVVTPGQNFSAPPSDAIVLFDGRDLDNWVNTDGKKPGWTVADGAMTVARITGDRTYSNGQAGSIYKRTMPLVNASRLPGTTENIGKPKTIALGRGAIRLQDHGNPTSFRNIWVREISEIP